MEINDALARLKEHKIQVVRSPKRLSFGDRAFCSSLFLEAFKAVDKSIQEFKMLPEYEKIVDWMEDNHGKGLMLQGDCGRGKSVIVSGVIPAIFFMRFGIVLHPFHADNIPDAIQQLSKLQTVVVDEVGVEPMANDFGGKYEGFNRIINAAENSLKLVFITTNLSSAQILQRYGERTVERLSRLCKIVKFEGDSLRPF